MSTSAATVPESSTPSAGPLRIGRTFVSPLFDYLLIGGGLSLIFVFGLQWLGGGGIVRMNVMELAPLILLTTSVHFAASTVRLYTKPGAWRDLPFLTMGFPLLTIAVVTLCILYAHHIGRHLNSLYLTWSPFHYAAQTYGLSVMYSYRSGCALSLTDKRLMRAGCLLPFFYAFVNGQDSGLGWFLPASAYEAAPWLRPSIRSSGDFLISATFIVPLLLLIGLRLRRSLTLPLIVLLLMVSNGIWWIMYTYMDAFVWATVFHGIQYIVIVTIFHVKDQTSLPGNRHGAAYHSLAFYVMCLVLAYLSWHVWPLGFKAAGFGGAESMMMVAAAINIHHFVVDGYIWRLRKDPNYKIVTGGAPQPA